MADGRPQKWAGSLKFWPIYEPSPVLLAMGISAEVAQTAVRFSFDSTITAAELQEAGAAVRTAVGSVQALGPTS